MPIARKTWLALLAAVALPCSAFALTPEESRAVRTAADKTLPEFVEFLCLPNVTHKSTADMRKNADWLEAAFNRHGFESRQLEDGETPMVFAQSPGASTDRKTILFYAHMDGQAVFPKDGTNPTRFSRC